MTTEPGNGFLAEPDTGPGSGVLVLHAWWGLNDTIRGVCTRLARDGFTAFAPDLYDGRIAKTVAEAESLGQQLDANYLRARSEIAAAAGVLNERASPSDGGLAVLGFSLGAVYALDLATAKPDLIRSVVLYYGTGGDDFRNSRAAYLGHFAENDPYEPPANVDQLEAALREAGCRVTFHRYPDAGHWFSEPDRTDAYHPEAAGQAWERTLALLREEAVRDPKTADSD